LTLGVVVGLAVGAAMVAACTTYGNKPTENGGPSPAQAPRPKRGSPTKHPRNSSRSGGPTNALAKTSDVPVGSGVIVGDVVIMQPASGDFRGISTTCTHAGASCPKSEAGRSIARVTAADSGSTAQWPTVRHLNR
jgi:hypothetical protein